ncbi:MAG: hypothetical protein ACJ72W_04015 [Actinoallomurus sp.]
MRRPSWSRLRAGAALVPAAVLIAAGIPATAHAAPVRTTSAGHYLGWTPGAVPHQ